MDGEPVLEATIDAAPYVTLHQQTFARFRRVHFFAGIGGRNLARLAGWQEDEEVWTGSCPCQPFSVAGKRGRNRRRTPTVPEFFKLVKSLPTSLGNGDRQVFVKGWTCLSRRCIQRLKRRGLHLLGGRYLLGQGRALHIEQRLYLGDTSDNGVFGGVQHGTTTGGKIPGP